MAAGALLAEDPFCWLDGSLDEMLVAGTEDEEAVTGADMMIVCVVNILIVMLSSTKVTAFSSLRIRMTRTELHQEAVLAHLREGSVCDALVLR